MIPADEIARLVGGTLLRGDGCIPVRAVHDSRLVQSGDLFVALPGRNTDGHVHLEEAFARGASAALISRSDLLPDNARNLILVPHCLTALQTWASAWRNRSRAAVFAITGTNGKTTVKRLLGHLLAGGAQTYVAPHNYNTEIGLPLAMLSMPAESEVAVFELGADRPGDISVLAHILRPTCAVITSIGPGHLDRLKTLDAVAEEKGSLIDAIPADGFAVLPIETVPLMQQANRARCRIITVGSERGDVRGRVLRSTPHLEIRLAKQEMTLSCPLIGKHHADNVLLACAAAHASGVSWATIETRLPTFRPPQHRLQRVATSWGTLLDDTYNANPASTAAALHVLANLEPGAPRRVFVFGDMCELGPRSPQYHQDILNLALSLPIDLILPVGETSAAVCQQVNSPRIELIGKEDLAPRLRQVPHGSVILVKGSRTLGLETLVDALQSTR